jgi:TonB family protein
VTQPVIVAMVWPEFPKAAKKQLKVPIVLAVHVTAEGAVDQVEVEAESGCPPCEAAAIASAWQLKFEPATRDGVPIPMWTRFPVVFGRR